MWSPVFLLLLIFSGLNARAQDKTLEERAQDMTAVVQRQVGWAADFLDVELAGRRYLSTANPSHINVSQLVTLEEGTQGIRKSTNFGLNLRLPNVEKRWALRFSSYDEDQEDRDINQRTVRTVPPERNYGTALILFKQLGRIKVSFQPRLQLTNPLQMNYTLRFASEAKLTIFQVKPNLEFFADSQKGTGEYFSIDVNYKPGGRWQFGLENQEQYQQNANDFTTGHGLTSRYQIDDRSAWGQALIFSGENHAFHMVSINLSTTYNYQIFKKILNCALSPYWFFSKAYNFKGHVGISLNIDATF